MHTFTKRGSSAQPPSTWFGRIRAERLLEPDRSTQFKIEEGGGSDPEIDDTQGFKIEVS